MRPAEKRTAFNILLYIIVFQCIDNLIFFELGACVKHRHPHDGEHPRYRAKQWNPWEAERNFKVAAQYFCSSPISKKLTGRPYNSVLMA